MYKILTSGDVSLVLSRLFFQEKAQDVAIAIDNV
jgi:hypothetical protein